MAEMILVLIGYCVVFIGFIVGAACAVYSFREGKLPHFICGIVVAVACIIPMMAIGW